MAKTDIITRDTVVVRNDKKFITSPIGDEIVMMSMESGNYIGINEVSAAIWNRIEQPIRVSEIVNHLLSMYDISEDECIQKTITHLNEMAHEEMILITP